MQWSEVLMALWLDATPLPEACSAIVSPADTETVCDVLEPREADALKLLLTVVLSSDADPFV